MHDRCFKSLQKVFCLDSDGTALCFPEEQDVSRFSLSSCVIPKQNSVLTASLIAPSTWEPGARVHMTPA